MSTPRGLRLALHAFPRRFRTRRAAEIEATFHEAELAGERHPYGAQALTDVVIAGWRERARSRPPLGTYVKYRLLGGRLELRWHAWMLDEVHGLFSVRRMVLLLMPMLFVWTYLNRRVDWSSSATLIWIAVVVLAWTAAGSLGGRRDRRRILRLHGYDPETRAWLPPQPMMPLIVRAPRPVRVAPLAVGPAAAFGLVFPLLCSHRSARSGSLRLDGGAIRHAGSITSCRPPSPWPLRPPDASLPRFRRRRSSCPGRSWWPQAPSPC